MKRLTLVCSLVVPAAFIATGCTAGVALVQSARHHAATRHPATLASQWKVVSYHGVHLRVPAGWPVIDARHAPLCGGPFPATPTVYVGPPSDMALSCPADIPPRGTGNDGAWLQTGTPPPGARPVVLAGGRVVDTERVQAGAWGHRVMQLWYHGVFVQIGIGRHRKVAREILRSLGYTRGTPDSKVADVCRRSKGPVRMPAPQRLDRRLVVDHGDITMAPPLRSDRPVISAALVWRDGGTKSVFERYRLLLVRYSSKYPAGPTPEYRHVFAWVIYSSPFSAVVAGCGDYGVSGFDATTGKALPDDIWSPGP